MKSIFFAAAIAIAVASSPALARTETAKITVDYTDLDLATSQGQEALKQRLEKAARQVCEVDGRRTGSRGVPADVRACYRQAKSASQRQFAAILEQRRSGG